MRNLVKPIWKIINNNNGDEVIVVCSYVDAIHKAKALFNNNSFSIKLCCKGL